MARFTKSNFDFGEQLDQAHGLKKWIGLHSMTKLAQGIVARGASDDPKLRYAGMPKRSGEVDLVSP